MEKFQRGCRPATSPTNIRTDRVADLAGLATRFYARSDHIKQISIRRAALLFLDPYQLGCVGWIDQHDVSIDACFAFDRNP